MTRAVEKYYSVGEVALLLGFSEKWVRTKISSGVFPGTVDCEGDIRVPASDVNAYLDSHRVFEPTPISARSEGELRRKLNASAA